MEADFLKVLSKINWRSFRYRSVSAGDVMEINGSTFNVLWPPAVIESDDTLAVIRNAIEDFDSALKEDEELRRIYEHLQEGEVIRPYLPGEERSGERPGHADRSEDEERFPFPVERPDLPEVVRRANNSLRSAANHMSLAFCEDNRLLFLGDLDQAEIRIVAEELASANKTRFYALMAAHHGTHWDDALRRIRANWVISSIGNKLFKNARPEYKDIADRCLLTYLTGDAHVSLDSPWPYVPRWIPEWEDW
jgi:hypothetical protein